MVSIDARDPQATDRTVPGHGQGDLIIGANGATAAAALVRRPCRFTTILVLPEGKSSDALADVLTDTVHAMPELVRGTLTWDQGSEMARHAALTTATSLPDPHSPWQRPTNENNDPRTRTLTASFASTCPKAPPSPTTSPTSPPIADELKDRPRAFLGYLHPTRSLTTCYKNNLLRRAHTAVNMC